MWPLARAFEGAALARKFESSEKVYHHFFADFYCTTHIVAILHCGDPHLNVNDKLYTIDHFLNLDFKGHHLQVDQTGYKSNNLFSLCGDGPQYISYHIFY